MAKMPFDVATLLKDPVDASPNEDAYAPSGTGSSPVGSSSGSDSRLDRRGFAPGPKNTPEAIPEAPAEDAINPSHYRKHPSGIECIEVTRHMNFNVGNAIKYLWRYMDKGDPITNLQKAQWYIDDEIRRLQGMR